MSRYDSDQLAELCSKIDLLEYASQNFEFKKINNDSYACSCPRHVDVTPSLKITPSLNRYHCFSCGAKGSIIDFIMMTEKLSFAEAVEKVAKLTGTDIKQLKSCDALAFYKTIKRMEDSKSVAPSHDGREILDWSYYEQFDKDFPEEWLQEGISKKAMNRYEIRVDNNSNRICYPIYDKVGNLIGVKGRSRFNDFKALGISKYMNYTKIGTSDFFVGMKQAKESIVAKNEIIIFEGIKSCMKAYDYGFQNTVAAETSCLNIEQVKILLSMRIKDIVIGFDSDVTKDKVLKSVGSLKRFVNVWMIPANERLVGIKAAPVDAGKDVWEKLYNNKIRL